jgi:general secretion pathway protein G
MSTRGFLKNAALLFAMMGTSYSARAERYDTVARVQMLEFKRVHRLYQSACGQFPTTEQGLMALVEKPARKPICKHYPKKALFQDSASVAKDPWGHVYNYESDGKNFKITSYGRDGKRGGEGADADIIVTND